MRFSVLFFLFRISLEAYDALIVQRLSSRTTKLKSSFLDRSSSFKQHHLCQANNNIPSYRDEELICQQLGYVPNNFVCVSARLSDGTPIAIQTYPLQGGAPRRQAKSDLSVGTPFPTMYWLTNPEISRAIAELERRGYVSMIEATIKSDPELVDQLYQCHAEYAQERWESLSPHDRERLCAPELKRARNMLEHSGVAGTNFTDGFPSIKCLHGHYADYRSSTRRSRRQTVNPVGHIVQKMLEKEFSFLDVA